MNEKIDLYSLTDTELEELFVSLGEPKYRAKQMFPRLAEGTPLVEMTNLSKQLRERLAEITLDTLPRVVEKLTSRLDGTIKYLFRLHDGECIESVFMRYKHGNTLCISSQVGCYMGCKFCASPSVARSVTFFPRRCLGRLLPPRGIRAREYPML